MLLLAACDLQTEVISCYHQMKLMLVAVLFGWVFDLDTLSAICCSTTNRKWSHDQNDDDGNLNGIDEEELAIDIPIGPPPVNLVRSESEVTMSPTTSSLTTDPTVTGTGQTAQTLQ